MKSSILFTLITVLCSAVIAKDFAIKDNSPVKAGDIFELTVSAGSQDKSVTATFNGITRQIPGGIMIFKGFEHATDNSTIADTPQATWGKSVHNTCKYQTIFTVDMPVDKEKYSIWVRAKGSALCLRKYSDGKSAEAKWNWNRSQDYTWRLMGRFSAEELGGKFSLMTDNNSEPTYIDTVILSKDESFKPSGKLADNARFIWQTDASSVGRHTLPLSIKVENETFTREVSIEVLPAENGSDAGSDVLSTSSYEFIPFANSVISAGNLPDFNFINESYKKFFSHPVAGLKFPSTTGFIALDCKRYPDLPSSVRIEVGRKLAGFAFLHTQYWQGEVGQQVALYQVHYKDGSHIDIPLFEEVNICGSARIPHTPKAIFVYASQSPLIDFNITLLPWKNPHPDKEISHIMFTNSIVRNFKGENTTIPLNVSSMTSQILIHLAGINTDEAVNSLLTLLSASTKATIGKDTATVNFGEAAGKINPMIFSTNETGIMESDIQAFTDYLKIMDKIGCHIFRLHSGWNLSKIFPEGLTGPRHFEKLDNGIRRVLKDHPERKIMICINKIPPYIDPLKEKDRQEFAALCAELLSHFKKEGIPVEYWEIYNEAYFRGVQPDRSLWKMYNLTAEALKKIDPNIKIGGYAPCYPTVGGLADFFSHCNKNVDFISWHKYPTGSTTTSDEYLMKSTATFGDDARKIRAALKKIAPNRNIELALTEYNMNFDWKPHDPRQANHKGACWLASVLNHLIKADTDIAQTWHSRGGGTFGLVDRDAREIRPAAKVLYLGNNYIKGDYVSSESSHPDIEVLGFINPKQFGILVINKSAQEREVSLTFLNAPKISCNPFEGNTRVFSISETGYTITRETFFDASTAKLKLKPFETRVWVADR
jgi:xylan 1,4-beta-xylosidase